MENQHGDEVTKQIRLSLPNTSGALSMVTSTVSASGGIAGTD